ncbi:MAG: iron-containing alcohol dehydrogenase [Actinobacteria bacterium]|nr:iron-containing alcohol dehydrogenase [Actinomycetota bacterium]
MAKKKKSKKVAKKSLKKKAKKSLKKKAKKSAKRSAAKSAPARASVAQKPARTAGPVVSAQRMFNLATLSETVSGPGVAASLPQYVLARGKKAFIVTDQGVRGAGIVSPIVENLEKAGVQTLVFDQVSPNPTDVNVAAGVAALNRFGVDGTVVVFIGGGSVMDCGKYIALAAPNGIDNLNLAFAPNLDANDRIDFGTLAPKAQAAKPGLPTIAIPTTSGTASETNGGGLITDTTTNPKVHRKLTFSNPSVAPVAILLDPTLTVGMPSRGTAACGMDVLTHAIECYTSAGSNPYADALALHAIRLTGQWLPKAVANGSDLEARAQMQIASHLAGRAFSSGPLLGLVHATGHPISGQLHQAHGQTLATMLPHVMRFNRDVVAQRYADVGEALGSEHDPEAGIAAVEKLSATVGTNKRLRELGATSDNINDLTQDALRDLIILNTPKYPTRGDVHELYARAL